MGGIPEGSRAAKPHGFLRPAQITAEKLARVGKLNDLARARGQTLAQMALAWVLRHKGMTSVLVGASSVGQVEENVAALDKLALSGEELAQIEAIPAG